jgi:hypothetical protein
MPILTAWQTLIVSNMATAPLGQISRCRFLFQQI